MEKLHRKIKQFINQYNLIDEGDNLILGISGGADSMLLLHYFMRYKEEYKVNIEVAHINHGIREAAKLDAELVEKVCKDNNIMFHIHHCNIHELSKSRRVTEEEAGRQERYDFFISLLKPNGKIVTAHNMNDQAETMLMRFMRGTDIKGLAGISPKRDNIIRPLLGVSRAEIEECCERNNIPYRHDETNFQPIYSRNKIRLELLPYIMEKFNPGIIETLYRQSVLYREEEQFLNNFIDKAYEDVCINNNKKIAYDIQRLAKYDSYVVKRLILRAIDIIIGRKDITSTHVNAIMSLLNLNTGKQIHLPYDLVVYRDYSQLIFMKKEAPTCVKFCKDLSLGINNIEEAGLSVKLTLVKKENLQQNIQKMYTKYIDYDKIKSSLQIRTRASGDYMILPTVKKKLKKLFIDDKVSKTIRDSLPLIADGDDIVLILGSRLSSEYYVTKDTVNILEVNITMYE